MGAADARIVVSDVDRRPGGKRGAAPRGLTAATAAAPPRRILIILNPAAGQRRRARRRLRRVLAELARRGCAVTVRTTTGPGDAERLAGAAEAEFDLVVAAGGDGTVQEVANGLFGASRILGVLPLGTANVLACELGLPRQPKRIAAYLAEARPRPIWPGRIKGRLGDRLFLCMSGVGFDAAVVASVDPRLKRRFGKFAFLWAILKCLARHRPGTFSIGIDGAEHRVGAAVIAKTRFYAGCFVLAPAARAADPLFQVVLFPPGSRRAVLRVLAALALGIAHRAPGVRVIPARTVSLTADGEWPVQADGEIVAGGALSATIAEQPLLVLAAGPPASP
ncbi:MAG: diacylglycerol/lipid kinase family protein [Stellaceae bacterium]